MILASSNSRVRSSFEVKELLWKPDADVIRQRLQRFDVPMEKQEDFESQK